MQSIVLRQPCVPVIRVVPVPLSDRVYERHSEAESLVRSRGDDGVAHPDERLALGYLADEEVTLHGSEVLDALDFGRGVGVPTLDPATDELDG